MALEINQFTKEKGDEMRRRIAQESDERKDQKFSAASFKNRQTLTELRNAKIRAAQPPVDIFAHKRGEEEKPVDFADLVPPEEPEVVVEEDAELPPETTVEEVAPEVKPQLVIPVDTTMESRISLLEGQLNALESRVESQGNVIEDEHDEDYVFDTGPDRNKYIGQFRLSYINSGKLFVGAGHIVCPNGTGEWSNTELSIATDEYMVLAVTLDADLSFASAALEASASLSTIVSSGLVHRRVIGKKLADPFYTQYHEGNIVIDSSEASASACLIGTTAITTGNAAHDFGGINHRTNTDIIYVADLAGGPPAVTDTITVKEGYSGIYKLTLQCNATIAIAAGVTDTAYARVSIFDGSDNLLWWELAREETPPAYSGTSITKEDSASVPIYIDASSDDIDLTAIYNVSGTDVELYINYFAVELVQLTDSSGA